ncbi:glycosyltransferase family 4 protein [Noviherbaspirillum massiliense]|uniref:glycosyltransferase family 4 protein n=1 Tax=Noviherbaspirillum massiliense TaxID=1465823 RepID=UPI0002FE9E99|nr:glycosyltransferase [Noviherbaspirillum massiliense]
MSSFLISFIASALLTLLLIKQSKLHQAALDSDLSGVQKVHSSAVPRIGGIGIFASVILTSLFATWRAPLIGQGILLLLACSGVAFLGGIVEDFTKRVSPRRRLILTMAAAAVGYFFLDARIERIDWFFSVWWLKYAWIALPLTVLAVAGIANAINIIDGFNGLASVVTICMLFSLGYVAWQVNDMFILVAAFIVAGATAGFLIWNYPAGLIFLGDGGAYFLGFMLGELSILLVMRNPEVSTWYALLLLIYPVFETLFSVYRRFFLRGQSPGAPDGIHLHSLIFRRIAVWAVGDRDAQALTRQNAITSPYLWLLSLMAVAPATLFWQHTWVLMVFSLLFIVSYIWLYARIVRFRSPRWMILGKRR